jgi:hypothetical protein
MKNGGTFGDCLIANALIWQIGSAGSFDELADPEREVE